MAKINLDELRADREAGTDGPWVVWQALGKCGVGDSFADVAHCSGFYSRRTTNEELANSRRIARLPDLEAAFLEAVELLERWIEHAVACEDDSMELYSTRLFLDHNT